jgi:hypothetical protein
LKEVLTVATGTSEAYAISLRPDNGAGIENEAKEAGLLAPNRRNRRQIARSHCRAYRRAE